MTLTDIGWIKVELLRALHELASDGDVALAGYPDGTAKADELACDYSHFLECVISNCPELFDRTQVEALKRIDTMLHDMSGPTNADLWSAEAVRSHGAWASVRAKARAAVDAIGPLLR